ncbi:hypothetical protein J7L13_01375 [bacterium]|nr:hypothetical protein [bacterium]
MAGSPIALDPQKGEIRWGEWIVFRRQDDGKWFFDPEDWCHKEDFSQPPEIHLPLQEAFRVMKTIGFPVESCRRDKNWWCGKDECCQTPPLVQWDEMRSMIEQGWPLYIFDFSRYFMKLALGEDGYCIFHHPIVGCTIHSRSFRPLSCRLTCCFERLIVNPHHWADHLADLLVGITPREAVRRILEEFPHRRKELHSLAPHLVETLA